MGLQNIYLVCIEFFINTIFINKLNFLIDMIKCDVTPVHEIKTLILDKVDQMLHKGLLDYLYQIYSLLTPATQVLLKHLNTFEKKKCENCP